MTFFFSLLKLLRLQQSWLFSVKRIPVIFELGLTYSYFPVNVAVLQGKSCYPLETHSSFQTWHPQITDQNYIWVAVISQELVINAFLFCLNICVVCVY